MTNVPRQLCLLAFALACNFDGAGFGDPPPASAGDAPTASTGPASSSSSSSSASTDPTTGVTATTSTTDVSTSSGTTLPLTSTDPSTTSTSAPDDTTGQPGTTTGDDTTTTDDTTTSTTSSTTSTTGPASCADTPYKQIVHVAEATTVAPMIKAMSQQAPQEGVVAYSGVAEQGTVSFPIDVPCDGQLYVWGRVLDFKPGTGGDDPDSFYTRVDGGPESSWFYGCQTGGESSAYRWKRMRSGMQGEPCDAGTIWPVSVTAGAHTITLRNREKQSQGGGVAAIARIMITSDPDAPPAPGD